MVNTFLLSGASAWAALWAHKGHLYKYSIPLSIVSIVWGLWCFYETRMWEKEVDPPGPPTST